MIASKMYRPVLITFCLILSSTASSRASSNASTSEPTLLDRVTGTEYQLEHDKKHVRAIDRAGEVLWRSEPYIDAKLPLYRIADPSITYFDFATPKWWKSHQYLGKAEDFICIDFSSSQFGVLDKHNGKFHYFGQD